MVRKLFLSLLSVCLVVGIWQRELVCYGWMQTKGQFQILWNTHPVEEILADPFLADSLKKKIKLIGEIKRYAIDSLGINPSGSYTRFYNQQGKPILWVVIAAEPYRLIPKEWTFPIIGTFSYKGFFEKEGADQAVADLRHEKFDTRINEVSAWSTLGFFKDPILSSMLKRSDGSLAELIIHELTHGTLFVKNNLEYNENLADFVGEYGALRFLAQKYGTNSLPYQTYLDDKEYNKRYDEHILRGTRKLDSLYATYNLRTSFEVKEKRKWQLIGEIINTIDTLMAGAGRPFTKTKHYNKENLPNNAYFIGYKTYRQQQNHFRKEFEKRFNSNFKEYLAYLKKTYPSL